MSSASFLYVRQCVHHYYFAPSHKRLAGGNEEWMRRMVLCIVYEKSGRTSASSAFGFRWYRNACITYVCVPLSVPAVLLPSLLGLIEKCSEHLLTLVRRMEDRVPLQLESDQQKTLCTRLLLLCYELLSIFIVCTVYAQECTWIVSDFQCYSQVTSKALFSCKFKP